MGSEIFERHPIHETVPECRCVECCTLVGRCLIWHSLGLNKTYRGRDVHGEGCDSDFIKKAEAEYCKLHGGGISGDS